MKQRLCTPACTRWAVVFLFIVSLLAPSLSVQAGGIEVLRDEYLIYSGGLILTLTAESSARIDQVTLIHGLENKDCLNSQARQDIEVRRPGKHVELEWDWDQKRGALPPGVEVWWQWEIHDEDGAVTTTERQTLRFYDPRFNWQEVRSGRITLQYAEGGSGFGAQMLKLATDSLERLAVDAGLSLSEDIRMTIYPSVEDMQGALAGLVEWAGGVAFPEYQVILIGIAPGERAWAESVIPHELTHLVTEMRVFNCAGADLPHWLHEGLAEYAEGPVPLRDQKVIRQALEDEALPDLRTLSAGFSADSRQADQAYKQSRVLVSYLIEEYGPQKMDALMDEIQQGKRIDAALRAVYGLDTDGIDQTWRASLGFGEAPAPDFSGPTATAERTAIPTIALFQPVVDTPTPTVTLTPLPPTPTFTPAPVTPESTPTAVPMPAPAGFGGTAFLIAICGGIVTVLVLVGLFIFLRHRSTL